MPEQENEKNAPEKKGLNKKTIIIAAVAALFLIAVAGFFIGTKFISKSENKTESKISKTETNTENQSTETKKKIKIVAKPIYKLSPFIVNISGSTGERFLKVELQLELDTENLKKELDLRKPQVRDLLIKILSSKTVEDINSMAGKVALQKEIALKINRFLKTGKITNVYFTDFVMQ